MFAAKKIATAASLAVLLATGADAAQTGKSDPRIAELCGAEHRNELTDASDFMPNPAGFFIKTTSEQIDISDERIVWTNIEEPYVCSRPVASPMTHHAEALAAQGEREVRYLFVPNGNVYPTTGSR
ncbi:MAG TPA: hypothetical protein VKA18_09820 [Alphaproteobacteria bacterium]|nr:hypothetical protein [Alphaproteobacteria bacterium]